MSKFTKGDRVTFTDGWGKPAEGIVIGRQSWGGAHFGVERYSVARTDRGIANDMATKYADMSFHSLTTTLKGTRTMSIAEVDRAERMAAMMADYRERKAEQ